MTPLFSIRIDIYSDPDASIRKCHGFVFVRILEKSRMRLWFSTNRIIDLDSTYRLDDFDILICRKASRLPVMPLHDKVIHDKTVPDIRDLFTLDLEAHLLIDLYARLIMTINGQPYMTQLTLRAQPL